MRSGSRGRAVPRPRRFPGTGAREHANALGGTFFVRLPLTRVRGPSSGRPQRGQRADQGASDRLARKKTVGVRRTLGEALPRLFAPRCSRAARRGSQGPVSARSLRPASERASSLSLSQSSNRAPEGRSSASQRPSAAAASRLRLSGGANLHDRRRLRLRAVTSGMGL